MPFRLFTGVTLLLIPNLFAQAAGWEVIEFTDGIEVALREEAGRNLPTLRGRTTLNGNILHLLAILLDARRSTEWAEGATRIEVLSQENPPDSLVYTYTDLTWPVSDRDVIMQSDVRIIKPGEEYLVRMSSAPELRPEKDGVVRIKEATAHFHFKRPTFGKIWVEYMVNVDPGGSLPKWLVARVSRSVPLNTLKNLQKQLDSTRGEYALEMEALRHLQ